MTSGVVLLFVAGLFVGIGLGNSLESGGGFGYQPSQPWRPSVPSCTIELDDVWEEKCETVFEDECHTQYHQQCRNVPNRECSSVDEEKCTLVDSKKCSQVPVPKCRVEYDQQCTSTPVCKNHYTKECTSHNVPKCHTEYEQECTQVYEKVCKQVPVQSYAPAPEVWTQPSPSYGKGGFKSGLKGLLAQKLFKGGYHKRSVADEDEVAAPVNVRDRRATEHNASNLRKRSLQELNAQVEEELAVLESQQQSRLSRRSAEGSGSATSLHKRSLEALKEQIEDEMAALEKGDSESFTTKTRRDSEEIDDERESLNYPAPTQTRVRRTLKGLKGKGEIWTPPPPQVHTSYQSECWDEPREKCHSVPRQVCVDVPKQSCRDVPQQVCNDVEHCKNVPRKECTTDYKEVCVNVPTKECHSVPREVCHVVQQQQCEDVGVETCQPIPGKKCEKIVVKRPRKVCLPPKVVRKVESPRHADPAWVEPEQQY